MLNKPKGSPFHILRHCETFQNDHFLSQNWFPQQGYIRSSDVISEVYCASLRRKGDSKILRYIRFLFNTGVFVWYYVTFFIEALSILTTNKTFCDHSGLLGGFGIMRLIGEYFRKKIQKNIERFSTSIFHFLKLSFLNLYPLLVFVKTIRIFDIIFDVRCVPLKRGRGLKILRYILFMTLYRK